MIRVICIIVALSTAASLAGPLPPLERFPPQPYVVPPTAAEKAKAQADRVERDASRSVYRAAVSNLLAAAGVELDAPVGKMTPAARRAVAKKIDQAAQKIRKGKKP
jgi:hypothetical protein